LRKVGIFADQMCLSTILLFIRENKVSKLNQATVQFAKDCIPLFKNSGVKWPELSSPERVVRKIQRQLASQKLDNLLDVEDILNQLLYDVMVLGRYAKMGNAIKFILTNTGNSNTNKEKPIFVDLPESSNDDDLQGSESDPNNLDRFSYVDISPGSDLHVASIDIEDKFGEDASNVFDLKLAGHSEREIAKHIGTNRETIKRLWSKLKDFLNENGYEFDELAIGYPISSWNKSRKQSERNWDLPNSNHRSIIVKEQ